MKHWTEKEELMASIWTSVLGQAIRSPEAQFLALGGSSLLAMQVAAEAADKFGRPVSVADVLMSTTLRELVSVIEIGK
ncbi:phosphopantetheine-binding protein [Bradyrhizobium sp. Ec3.3]|uniref:phosphopantetheine-binding protein n=1 Tax=Bradyrhizobium sp. Ec3.3 TaxID=189753 RepID=UPI000406A4CA|nr:phosphopantetheine-binding protein [Bradyrhizobium sp. Ec3.3]